MEVIDALESWFVVGMFTLAVALGIAGVFANVEVSVGEETLDVFLALSAAVATGAVVAAVWTALVGPRADYSDEDGDAE
jgi:hypothetical protein